MAGFVLEISTVIRFGRGPQDTLSVEVDIILMIHKNPAPEGQENKSQWLKKKKSTKMETSVTRAERLPDVKLAMPWL